MRTIITRKLSKRYRVPGPDGRRRDVYALDSLDLEVKAGERLAVIGRNGSGKSTLLKLLSRVVPPTAGEAEIFGTVTSLLEIGTGFNPRLTGRENIFLNAALHGLSRNDVRRSLDSIIDFAELGDFIDHPLKTYSSGMRSRLAFAVAAHLDTDILMLDEVLAVGDAGFQNKCLARINEITGELRTLLFVSHSMDAVARFCNRAVWLDQGRLVDDGPVQRVSDAYLRSISAISPTFKVAQLPRAKTGAGRERAAADRGTDAVAPFNPVDLVSAQVVNRSGRVSATLPTTAEIGVEVVFDVLAADASVEPALAVTTEDDRLAFVGAFIAADWPEGFNRPGRYRCIAWIPRDLLNTGVHRVTISLVRPDPLIRHQRHDSAVSFFVSETHESKGSTRGRYGRKFPGAVRPRLVWTVEHMDHPPSAVTEEISS